MTQHQAPEVTSELLECPLCNREPKRNGRTGVGGVICQSPGHLVQVYGASQADADKNWNTRATQPLSLTVDEETVARLRKRYTAETVPPCPVCGEPLSIQAAGGGSITWGCVKRDEGKNPLDDHYERSRWQQLRTGDSDVIALLDRLQSLSLPESSLQKAQTSAAPKHGEVG